MPSRAGADGGEHRNQLGLEHGVEHGAVDLLGLADEAEIDDRLDLAVRIDDAAGQLLGGNERAVLSAQADGLATLGRDPAHDLLVDRAGEHHFDDLDGLLVGDAQPVAKFRLDPELVEHTADLRAAAMADDRLDACLLEQHHILGEVLRRGRGAERMAAILDHDDLLIVALHMRQRLHQEMGLGRGGGQIGHGRKLSEGLRAAPLLEHFSARWEPARQQNAMASSYASRETGLVEARPNARRG